MHEACGHIRVNLTFRMRRADYVARQPRCKCDASGTGMVTLSIPTPPPPTGGARPGSLWGGGGGGGGGGGDRINTLTVLRLPLRPCRCEHARVPLFGTRSGPSFDACTTSARFRHTSYSALRIVRTPHRSHSSRRAAAEHGVHAQARVQGRGEQGEVLLAVQGQEVRHLHLGRRTLNPRKEEMGVAVYGRAGASPCKPVLICEKPQKGFPEIEGLLCASPCEVAPVCGNDL